MSSSWVKWLNGAQRHHVQARSGKKIQKATKSLFPIQRGQSLSLATTVGAKHTDPVGKHKPLQDVVFCGGL